jgi:hypothetical protein
MPGGKRDLSLEYTKEDKIKYFSHKGKRRRSRSMGKPRLNLTPLFL